MHKLIRAKCTIIRYVSGIITGSCKYNHESDQENNKNRNAYKDCAHFYNFFVKFLAHIC